MPAYKCIEHIIWISTLNSQIDGSTKCKNWVVWKKFFSTFSNFLKILVKISSLGIYPLKKCSKYAQICPKKVILCQNNGILAKYAKICSIKLGSFYSEFSESQKKYRYAQTPATWKICQSIFCLSLVIEFYRQNSIEDANKICKITWKLIQIF